LSFISPSSWHVFMSSESRRDSRSAFDVSVGGEEGGVVDSEVTNIIDNWCDVVDSEVNNIVDDWCVLCGMDVGNDIATCFDSTPGWLISLCFIACINGILFCPFFIVLLVSFSFSTHPPGFCVGYIKYILYCAPPLPRVGCCVYNKKKIYETGTNTNTSSPTSISLLDPTNDFFSGVVLLSFIPISLKRSYNTTPIKMIGNPASAYFVVSDQVGFHANGDGWKRVHHNPPSGVVNEITTTKYALPSEYLINIAPNRYVDV
jgi:hypothetical protein